MKKIFLLILSLFFLFPANVSAESEFLTKAEVVYDVGEDGVTTVTNNITLTNVFSNLYATSYAMQVEGLEPTSVKAVEAGQVLPVTIEKDGEKTVIRVEFERDVVGKGKQRNFTISFTERSLAVKTGEVWETAAHDGIHRLSVLEQANDVMHADARPRHDRVAVAHARHTRDVSVRCARSRYCFPNTRSVRAHIKKLTGFGGPFNQAGGHQVAAPCYAVACGGVIGRRFDQQLEGQRAALPANGSPSFQNGCQLPYCALLHVLHRQQVLRLARQDVAQGGVALALRLVRDAVALAEVLDADDYVRHGEG